MVIKSKENALGAWAFLTGVILAIVIGVASSKFLVNSGLGAIKGYSSAIYAILVILGIIVGFVNVRTKDANTFLLTGAVLVVVSKFGMESVTGSIIGIGVGDVVTSTFGALLALFIPAVIIVALKAVFNIAKV